MRVNGISSTYPSVIPPIKISRLVGINDIDSMIFSGSGFFHTHKQYSRFDGTIHQLLFFSSLRSPPFTVASSVCLCPALDHAPEYLFGNIG